jgi:O-antigen/teichoic acid export membrane protein
MFDSIKSTIKHSFIYGLGNISSKLVGFFLLPLYTNYLTTSDYGILAILEITTQIIVSLFSFNISTAMMRWSSETKNENEKKSIIFTSLISTIFISLAITIILIPFRNIFSFYFFDSAKFSNYFLLLILSSSFGIYNLIPLTIMRLRERSSLFAFLNTFKFTLTLLLNIYFLSYKQMGVEGILISQLIGQIFLTIFSIPITIKNIMPNFRFSILYEMLSYGIPLVFSTIFTLAFTIGDRFIIKYFSGEASVGLYSLGHKMASIINIFILQSFQLGFLPIAYKKLGTSDEKQFFSKMLTYYTFILVFSALLISLFGGELIKVLAKNKDYWAASAVIPIIAFSFVLKGIQYTFSLSFHYSKKTFFNAVIVILTAIINVVMNIVLIQKFNFLGAGYSMFLSMLFMMLISYFLGEKVYPIPYEINKIFFAVITGVCIYLASTLFTNYSIAVNIILKLFLLITFPTILIIGKFFDSNEIEKMKMIISNRSFK